MLRLVSCARPCSELGADSASQDTSLQSACEGGPCRPGPLHPLPLASPGPPQPHLGPSLGPPGRLARLLGQTTWWFRLQREAATRTHRQAEG